MVKYNIILHSYNIHTYNTYNHSYIQQVKYKGQSIVHSSQVKTMSRNMYYILRLIRPTSDPVETIFAELYSSVNSLYVLFNLYLHIGRYI
jgi:hypothetical protein